MHIPGPAKTAIQIQSSDRINPTINQQPSPVEIRIYELKSDIAFMQADLMSLLQRDQTVLGPDLTSQRQDLVVHPGHIETLTPKPLSPQTRFIAVVGLFRDIDRAHWRDVAVVKRPLLPWPAARLTIQVDGTSISIQRPN